jgi:hypothetical protein
VEGTKRQAKQTGEEQVDAEDLRQIQAEFV